uniref:Uncharacterized protein n=1 Tax=Tanacetum cinerariifolium TaxID=118510 RepID=A0A6L2JZC4_TANCI|nr:hypothetical protein [Tanacetum cinerariifolium]
MIIPSSGNTLEHFIPNRPYGSAPTDCSGPCLNVAAERPKRPCKKSLAATDASELLACSILSDEAGFSAMLTMPFVTSSVSATPGHEDGTPLDSVTEANLRSVGPAIRLVISLDSSHHSSMNAPGAEVDSVIRFVVPPPVTIEESNSVDTIKPNVVGPSHPFGKELSLGSREVDSKNLHDVFVSHWNVPNDALLDDFDTSKEIIDHLAPPVHALESTCSCLHDQVSEYEQLKRQIEEFQDTQMNVVNEKVDKLDADLLEMACHLEERYYPYLLATISERRWLLTYGIKLFIVKCLNSSDCLTTLRATISRAIEKGMQSKGVIEPSQARA